MKIIFFQQHQRFIRITLFLLILSGPSIPIYAQSLYGLNLGMEPNITNPPAPHSVTSAALWYRWTPLCRDGSGDHEWTLDHTQGTAPTCINPVTQVIDVQEVVVCTDGTRPLYYLDKAVDSQNQDIETNNWLLFFPGGSNCGFEAYLGDSVMQIPGSPVQMGEMCHFFYSNLEGKGLSSVDEKEATAGLGFLNPNSELNPYRSFNRIRFENCTADRFTGDKTHANLFTDYDEFGFPLSVDTYTLYFHGRRMIQAVLNDLTGGVNYIDSGITKNLPPIEDAVNVLISAHSNGAIGLVHNLDRITNTLEALNNNPNGLNIRGYLDAAIRPGIENELAHFKLDIDGLLNLPDINQFSSNPPFNIGTPDNLASTIYDFSNLDWMGISLWGEIFIFNAKEYQSGGQVREKWQSWSDSVPDQSCIELHPGEEFRCYSLEHVWMNHITTPLFVSNRLQDTKQIHKPVDFDGLINWDARHYKKRIITQIDDFVAGAINLSEESNSSGIDPGVFITDGNNHAGVTDNAEALNICLDNGTPKSLVNAVYDWHLLNLPFQGVEDQNSSVEARRVACP